MLRKVLIAGGVVAVAILALSTPASATKPHPEHKVTICHIPPGNPANAHEIEVDEAAVPAHLAHGDNVGACVTPPTTPPTQPPVEPPEEPPVTPPTPPVVPEPPVTPPVAPEQPTVVVGEPTAPLVAPPATGVPIATGELAYTGASDWLPLAIAFAVGAIIIGWIFTRQNRRGVEPDHHLSQR